MPNNLPFLDDLTDHIKIIQKWIFLINFSIEGQNDTINIQKWMKSTIQIWMVSIYIQNWMTLIIQIGMKLTVVNIIQNWMTFIIQIRMEVTVVNIIQNTCGG